MLAHHSYTLYLLYLRHTTSRPYRKIYVPWSTVLSCLPIALFSETLRVQAAVVESLMTKILIAPGLTGSVKDLQQLWDIDTFDLFADFGIQRPLQVISLRPGNSFALANRGVL